MPDIKPLTERPPVPARIPYNTETGDMFGVTDHEWKAICETIYPDAQDKNTIALVLSHCAAKGYDPMAKPYHIVPMWDNKTRAMKDTIWPSIGLYRTLATRSGTYAGRDATAFGPFITSTFTGLQGKNNDRKSIDVTVNYPEWAQVTVHKIVGGVRVPFVGPKVTWLEFYSRAGWGNDLPTPQWVQRPSFMLEKTAESQALRSAWPELCDQPTAEEMQAVTTSNHPTNIIVNPMDEGRQAYHDGHTPIACPYLDDDPNYKLWHQAFLEAEREDIE